jgi:hypothetical protein
VKVYDDEEKFDVKIYDEEKFDVEIYDNEEVLLNL